MIKMNIKFIPRLLPLAMIVVMLSIATQSNGQARYFDERYITTQGHLNPVLVNPGAIGQADYHRLLFNYRNKWASFPGAPKSFSARYDGPIGNRLGLGVMVLSDNNGALQTLKGQLGLSYSLHTDINKMGIGISTEFINHGVDAGILNEETVDGTDVLLLSRLDGENFFDVSAGIQGVYADKFIYGLTFPGLVSSMLDAGNGDAAESTFGYMLQLGYRFDSREYDIVAEPSIVVKNLRYVPIHVDINVLAKFLDEKLTGGVTYTVGADERLGFLIGARVNAFNFFYSYNISRHEFQSYNNGSHELSVRFDVGRKDIPVVKNPMIEK